MKHIHILDCTLRDGGYMNNWEFDIDTQFGVMKTLNDSNIEIIECGFLDPAGDNLTTRFTNIDIVNQKIKDITQNSEQHSMFVMMIELENYDSSILPKIDPVNKKQITGVRLTFRKSSKSQFLTIAREIIEKGYTLFVQPISTASYSDHELLDLIELIKTIDVYALYIVDTHGSMNEYDLKRIFSIIDNNLNKQISIGFHSHNNLQLSFSLAIALTKFETTRTIIIDSTLMGMGRGAGNLNTELICEYINKLDIHMQYDLSSIVNCLYAYIMPLLKQYTWGYNIAYYLSASNKCHPNYASFLMDLDVDYKNMDLIFKLIPIASRLEFDKMLIMQIYKELLHEQ